MAKGKNKKKLSKPLLIFAFLIVLAMATSPAFPVLPVSASQANHKTFRLQLRYCDFCQQSTFHSCQPEEKEETTVDSSPYAISEGVLLKCSGCQAYTVA